MVFNLKKWKKMKGLIFVALLAFVISACGSTDGMPAKSEEEAAKEETSISLDSASADSTGKKTSEETTEESASAVEEGTQAVTGGTASAAQEYAEEDGQNPIMSFIGPYACGRAIMKVEADGMDGARISVTWGASAFESGEWKMSGKFDVDTLTVEYADCVKKDVVYKDEGEIESETVEYENGTGRITFREGDPLALVWEDDMEHIADDSVFEWSFVPVVDESEDDGSGTGKTSGDAGAVAEETIDYLALVNKLNPLPEDWEAMIETVHFTNTVGDDVEVEKQAYDAWLSLKEDLEKEGITTDLDSARRSVAEQQRIMDDFTQKYGADYAAKTVAKPGYSEHHTGLALDLYLIIDGKDIVENEDMIQYPEIWEKIHEKLADHGFILRYLKGKEHITGYGYEPWHIRYINNAEIAKEIMSSGQTLEGWLGAVNETEVAVDYGTSEVFTPEELEEAAVQIKCSFASWEGCEMHSLRYAGDENNTQENLDWLNSLGEGENYVKAAEFLCDFHSPVEQYGAWEADTEYTDYQWWLGLTEDGSWEIVTWGY